MTNRERYLALFEANKAGALFCGHLHDSAYAKYGELQLFTTSPIGKPHGAISSGLRIVKIVRRSMIESNFYELDEIPETIEFD
jgi:hypothetical protein